MQTLVPLVLLAAALVAGDPARTDLDNQDAGEPVAVLTPEALLPSDIPPILPEADPPEPVPAIPGMKVEDVRIMMGHIRASLDQGHELDMAISIASVEHFERTGRKIHQEVFEKHLKKSKVKLRKTVRVRSIPPYLDVAANLLEEANFEPESFYATWKTHCPEDQNPMQLFRDGVIHWIPDDRVKGSASMYLMFLSYISPNESILNYLYFRNIGAKFENPHWIMVPMNVSIDRFGDSLDVIAVEGSNDAVAVIRIHRTQIHGRPAVDGELEAKQIYRLLETTPLEWVIRIDGRKGTLIRTDLADRLRQFIESHPDVVVHPKPITY